ncbi:prenyltransferase [Deminuibacter soli]|uniref:Prenyltransferase n=2 Tax=Deminuibacter soli TaxID=2291815 RepID=A0A3E1NRS0_9BACT|nr:prenyltransferase [Deminuibacter soli]
MPVYWFALSNIQHIQVWHAVLVFFILHVLVYPSSNGYNSYMDRDTTPVGGIANPMQPTRQLLYVTLVMDALALLLSATVALYFAAGIACYILCSRMYSYRGIRLKKYPIIGFLTVILNQGALVFLLVYIGCNQDTTIVPWQPVVASALLIGGFYPITQVYQHKADAADNVYTISMLLGIKGTFVFCALVYGLALLLLFNFYAALQTLTPFLIVQCFFIPVIVYFIVWFTKVLRNTAAADFRHTMRMNLLASACTNLAFICLLILHQL